MVSQIMCEKNEEQQKIKWCVLKKHVKTSNAFINLLKKTTYDI